MTDDCDDCTDDNCCCCVAGPCLQCGAFAYGDWCVNCADPEDDD